MSKLTDHLLSLLTHIDKFTQEAETIAPVGLGILGVVAGLIHGTVAMLTHSPVTIPIPAPPPPPAA